jgi:MFS family permease
MSQNLVSRHDPFSALRIGEFRFFLINRFFLTLGIQLQSVAVSWQVYELTDNVLALGMIGLAEAIPFIIVSLFSGHVADTFNRKYILVLFTILFITVTSCLLYLSLDKTASIEQIGIILIFITIAIVGVIRGFLSAAYPSFLSQIVPRSDYGNAATWNSTVWHIASVLGPALAGFLIAISYEVAYLIDLSFLCIALLALLFVKSKPLPEKLNTESLFESISAGVKFVFKNQLLLGALSLDLFAVLFGGAVALLPAFSDKILHAGAVELGFLRAAPAIGAVVMALVIAFRPPKRNAGKLLFISVALFGLSTICFGLSTHFYWALFFLFLTGAFDNVSVVIRHTILQLSTPNSMRGRVSAVNGIFIGSSNEIGAFESGVTARAFGLKASILLGGFLTMVVVIITAKIAPKLRKLDIDQLEEKIA